MSFSSSVGSSSLEYEFGSRIKWQVEHASEASHAPNAALQDESPDDKRNVKKTLVCADTKGNVESAEKEARWFTFNVNIVRPSNIQQTLAFMRLYRNLLAILHNKVDCESFAWPWTSTLSKLNTYINCRSSIQRKRKKSRCEILPSGVC